MYYSDNFSISEVVERIIVLNHGLKEFWSNSDGWSPIEAAQLLTKSRLDRQLSLSETLRTWINHPELSNDGSLIMAWANLGSLVEGTMKLFLSVWYQTYKNDIDNIKKNGKMQKPDEVTIEPMRQYFKQKKIWRTYDEDWDTWIQHIQERRNSIHAFKDRDIGNTEEYLIDIRKYLNFLRYINKRLPYPDDVYRPREY